MAKFIGPTWALIVLLVAELTRVHGLPLSEKARQSKTTKIEFYDLFNLSNQKAAREQREKRQQSNDAATTCGYLSCPELDANRLNVHIIAHTHDDVGWLKTVDQYYYGTRKVYSQAGVQFILDSVIPQLVMDKEKRFIYVEMSFFSKWWHEQDEEMKDVVRRLVNEGRLEFINGGWCMNDEATVTYHSTIEQMTLGLKFLNETFGQCGHPKVGWQIDPFGHTNEQASLFAQFGFDGMFFTRISYIDKERRTESKSLDLIWHGDRALPRQSGSIFTNVFRDGYDAPNGFCFDSLCKDDMIVDNKKSYEYNLEQRGQYMISFIRHYASAKLTNQLLIPFGGDFQYSAAGQNFKSLDKLIKYIRDNAPDINIFYSTPSCYQYAVHERVTEKGIKLPEKYDDFMPYDSSATVWWSGYFTSRPSVKLVERETAGLLQVARLASVAGLVDQAPEAANSTGKKFKATRTRVSKLEDVARHERECLLPLWEILGDLQHHDAVTGTEKQHVANDYVRRAYDASKLCSKFLGSQRRRKLGASFNKSSEVYERLAASGRKLSIEPIFLEDTSFCSLNISQCESLEVPIDGCYHASKQWTPTEQPCAKSSSMYRLSSLRRNKAYSQELERRGVLVTAYNSLATQAKQVDIRLPCIGRCDLDKIQVTHLATNETMRLIRLPVPAGVDSLPFRNSLTKYEVLFYATIPALGGSSFVVSDTNEDDMVDDEASMEADPSRRFKRGEEPSAIGQDCDHCENLTNEPYDYVEMPIGFGSSSRVNDEDSGPAEQCAGDPKRFKRDEQQGGGGIGTDRVIVKFDMQSGMIIGLKRVSDGSYLNITQKFGTYSPSEYGHPPGAYTFRPNTTEPQLLQKPATFKMIKRNNGSLIEIHQKWTDWIWQTIRVDGRKNYIEFDYVVGPVPFSLEAGHEVVTRYITNMQNQGVFFTDSNGRQMLPRTKLQSATPEQLGGSFYPVVSTMMIRSIKGENSTTSTAADRSAEAVAILVDRAQAATSLNEGNLELLIHRRHMADDILGVGEALDEPGEDGRGLVTRGRHRLFLKFPISEPAPPNEEARQLLDSAVRIKSVPKLFKLPRTPRANVTYELELSAANLTKGKPSNSETDYYLVHDHLLNDLRQESIKYALKPVLTFDRLRTSARELVEMLDEKSRADFSLLNNSLPNNIHLLTLQAWNRRPNELLIRLENLDNPLTLTQFPSKLVYKKILASYKSSALMSSLGEESAKEDSACTSHMRPDTRVDLEYLIKRIRIVSLEEYNLGANVKLDEDKRLDWTQERDENACDASGDKLTTVRLTPRQIRTFLATYEFI